MNEETEYCETCGKECSQFLMLGVIDTRPGSTSFTRTFCTLHWRDHLLECAAQLITDFPMLKKRFDKLLKDHKKIRDRAN